MDIPVRKQSDSALMFSLTCVVVEMTMQFGRDSEGLQQDKK